MRRLTRCMWCMVAAVMLVGTLLWQPGAQAQGDEADPHAEERARLQQIIDAQVAERLDEMVTRRGVAMALKMKWPQEEPPKTLEDIVAEVEEAIAGKVDEKYPETQREVFERKAREKYRLLQPGDEVSFTIRGGVGTNTFVSGKVQQVTPQRIRVGNRWVVRTDMSEETCASFYEELSEKYIQRYIRVQNIRFDADRDRYRSELRRELLPKAFEEAGYIPRNPRLATSADPKHWISRRGMIDFHYERVRKQAETRLRPQVEKQVFEANEWTYVQDPQNPKRGDWVPKSAASSWRERLAGFGREKEAKDEEFGDEEFGEDPWGEPAEGSQRGSAGQMPGDMPMDPAQNPFMENQ